MKALVKEKAEPGLSLLDIEQPEIEHVDEVQFKVEYCAICVGETKVYDWNDWAVRENSGTINLVAGQNTVVGKTGTDHLENAFFGSGVGLGDQIDGAFLTHLGNFAELGLQNIASLISGCNADPLDVF